MKETIFALSTVPGLSAISIIRISGPNAFSVLGKITKGKNPKSRYASFKKIVWKREIIDQCIVITFKKNESYTGEKTVEIHCHGSIAVIEKILSVLVECGSVLNLRPAEEGEFTRQAFYNGKMDLIQVEGLSDLLKAETEAQRKISLNQLEGGFSKKIDIWKDKITAILAFLEAGIDFADEDIGQIEVLSMISELIELFKNEIDAYQNIRSIKDGIEIAIIGPPNVGKSTLINYLTKREVSLTSRIAGTTRDIIECRVQLKGVFVTFLDTAGLRETRDTIEKKGIAKLKKRLKTTVFNIFLINSEPDLKKIGVKVGSEDIVLKSKADKGNLTSFNGISGKTGFGVKEAIELIETKIPKFNVSSSVISTHRQKEKVNELFRLLSDLRCDVELGLEIEILAEKVRYGQKLLEELIGKIDTEEVLGIIFKNFCIGK